MKKAFRLKKQFAQNLLQMMSENLELRFVVPDKQIKKAKDLARMDAESRGRWKRLIYYLLNINMEVASYDSELRNTYSSLLQFAEYIEPRGLRNQ